MKKDCLRIIADANIWGAQSAFSGINNLDIDLQVLDHHDIHAASIKDADILLTRSSIQANQSLLEGSSVRFVGTATIGDDHVDKLYLQSQAITFSSAAGSSTDAVVEYMLAAFFELKQQGKLNFSQDTLGIIGVGRIGNLLDKACHKLGLNTMLNDPPRNLNTSLDELLETVDILTLHTPLEKGGEYPTYHLIGADELSKFKGKGIINAGRGTCVDNQALLDWLNQESEHFAVLDCWENEPNINLELLQHPQTLVATPHIAGHSVDGKAMNTFFVYKDLCSYLQVPPSWDMQADLPEIESSILAQGLSQPELILTMYPIQNDTNAMKQAASKSDFKSWFAHYRKHYPVRRSFTKVLKANDYPKDTFF